MRIKFWLVILIPLLMLMFTSCYDDEFDSWIDVPFYQCSTGYSAASAVAMVAGYYDHWQLSTQQNYILAEILDVNNNVSFVRMALFLSTNANCAAVTFSYPNTDDGQNSALSYIANTIQKNKASIMLLINEHYVPVTRVQGHWVNNLPQADGVWFHAYNAPSQYLAANVLKQYYLKPKNEKFSIIATEYMYNDYTDAASDYQWFKNNLGTYYGAPVNYIPTNTIIY